MIYPTLHFGMRYLHSQSCYIGSPDSIGSESWTVQDWTCENQYHLGGITLATPTNHYLRNKVYLPVDDTSSRLQQRRLNGSLSDKKNFFSESRQSVHSLIRPKSRCSQYRTIRARQDRVECEQMVGHQAYDLSPMFPLLTFVARTTTTRHGIGEA